MRKLVVVLAVLLLLPLSYGYEGEEKLSEEEQKLLERIEHFKKAVSEIRGKKFLQDFKVGIKTKQELREFLLEKLKKEEVRGEFDKSRKVLVTLGLMDPKLDLKKSLIKMLTEGVAGAYDPEKEELFIMKGVMRGPMQDFATAHEICHALQDQYYHLDAMKKSVRNNSDRLLVASAISEGEALLMGYECSLKESGRSVITEQDLGKQYRFMLELSLKMMPNSALAKVPRFLREMFFFGYGEGATFVQTVLKRHKSWKKLNDMFDNPPLSTEQVMHPEKYLDKVDYPVRILLPKLHEKLEGKWEEVMTDSMGEFALKVILSEFLDQRTSAAAAAGWDGDSFTLIESREKGGPVIFASLSVWDSGKDAKEFADAYAGALAKRFSAEPRKTKTVYLVEPKKGPGRAVVELAGTEVLIIQGAPLSLIPKVRSVILSARQVQMKERRFYHLSKQKLDLPVPEMIKKGKK